MQQANDDICKQLIASPSPDFYGSTELSFVKGAIMQSKTMTSKNTILSELLNQYERLQETSAKQLDDLDDAAVNRLYCDSLRAYAQSASRGAGVLA